MIYLRDPSSGKPSVTLSMFVLGMMVAILKLLVSGLTIKGFKMDQFNGVDFAAVAAALGGIYTLRRRSNNTDNK